MKDAYLARVDALLAAIAGTGISEIEVAEPLLRIRIVMGQVARHSVSEMGASEASGTSVPVEKTISSQPSEIDGDTVVEAPSYGQFHRAPAPGAPPFVEVGSAVRQGQELCIIEAMKVFTAMRSPVDGIVKQIFVENGADVAPGQALVCIEQLIADAAQ